MCVSLMYPTVRQQFPPLAVTTEETLNTDLITASIIVTTITVTVITTQVAIPISNYPPVQLIQPMVDQVATVPAPNRNVFARY